jgi:hypothetical protein
MTGDPDENEDILGFGNTDRVRPDRLRLRSDRLRLRLDRLTLRLTRRPRFTAVASGLAAIALTAGAATYLAVPSASATRSHTARPPSALGAPIQCTKAGVPVQVNARLAKFLKQLESYQSPGAFQTSGSITIQVGTTTYGVIMENPSTGQASCH